MLFPQRIRTARREHQSANALTFLFCQTRLKMSMQIFTELFKHLDTATFIAGVIFGIALSIAVVVIASHILRHWKAALILCAIISAASLLILAL